MLTKIKAMFGWRTVKKDSLWRYQENRVTGQRRAHRMFNHYTPPDQQWLRRTSDDPVPPKGGSGSHGTPPSQGSSAPEHWKVHSVGPGCDFETVEDWIRASQKIKALPQEFTTLDFASGLLSYMATDPATSIKDRAKYMAAARTCRELASKIEADSGNR